MIDPKHVLSNERTYLEWIKMSTTLAGVSSALLLYTKDENKSESGGLGAGVIGMILFPIAILFAVYATYLYAFRRQKIHKRESDGVQATFGPTMLTLLLILALTVIFIIDLFAGSSQIHL